MDEQFKKAEDEYFLLKGKLAAERITHDQFEAQLQNLMLQDAEGHYWMLGVDSGRWFRHDGAQWIEASPYTGSVGTISSRQQPPSLPERGGASQRMNTMPPPPVQQTKSGGGCGRNLACGCIALIVLLVLAGAGVFLGIRSGAITQRTLLNLVGLGPAQIEVDNFRDDAIETSILQLDPPKDSTPLQSSVRLNAFDIKPYTVQNPGKYRIQFRTTRGSNALGSCTLTIRSGDQYQFVALPERIVINRANNPAKVGSDFVIDKSSLCR